jgi:hypothetical protein
MEQAGEISDITCQPRYKLTAGGIPVRYESGRQAVYVADFWYKTSGGSVVVEDVKGYDTPLSKLKRALIEAELGFRVVIVR